MQTKDYLARLELQEGASQDDIKKAYRKMASKHHPDKGGDTKKFQEIQEAYDILSGAKKATHQGLPPGWHTSEEQVFSSMDEILAQMRSYSRHITPEFATAVPISQAFHGFTMTLQIDGQKEEVEIAPGTPHGARGQYLTKSGKKVIITVQLQAPNFLIKPITEASYVLAEDGTVNTGEIDTGVVEAMVDVDALDILSGAWINVRDILGEQLTVRVPAGFKTTQKLKVKGKGYINWSTTKTAAGKRADMFVRINPIFNPPAKLDKEKVKVLYNMVFPKSSEASE